MSEALDRAVAAIRERARERYGWAHVEVAVERMETRVVARGEVVAARQRAELAATLAAAAPGLDVDVGAVAMLRTHDWHALACSPTLLLRGAPGSPVADAIATELVFGDGPLERLATADGATLVRVVDGTLGWIDGALGPRTPRPLLRTRPFDAAAFAVAARRWLGTRYRLGGTTAAGIDCSALAQRCMAAAGALVPRHSSDQLAIGDAEGEGARAVGDLVMLWADDEAPCHVALAVDREHLVHASRSRACVVEEPRVDLLARATRVRHVARASIDALQRELAGFSDLADVLALGR